MFEKKKSQNDWQINGNDLTICFCNNYTFWTGNLGKGLVYANLAKIC